MESNIVLALQGFPENEFMHVEESTLHTPNPGTCLYELIKPDFLLTSTMSLKYLHSLGCQRLMLHETCILWFD